MDWKAASREREQAQQEDERRQEELDKQLFRAAVQGDARGVAQTLGLGANPRARHPWTTPLMEACSAGSVECVKLLVPLGGVEAVDPSSKTRPLARALEAGSAQCARLLLDAGAKLGRRDSLGRALAALAAGSGSVQALELALSLPGERFDSRDHRGRTPLMEAASRNKPEAVEFLVRLGAAEALDEEGRDAWSLAAQAGAAEAIEALLPWSDPLAVDGSGRTALAWATRHGKGRAVEALAKACPEAAMMADVFGVTPLMEAAEGTVRGSRWAVDEWRRCAMALAPLSDILAKNGSGKSALDVLRPFANRKNKNSRLQGPKIEAAGELLAALEALAEGQELAREAAPAEKSRGPRL